MANNISGFGASVRLVASTTFPAGITITQFADDSDPLDIPSLQIADKAMGVNGDLYTWSKANPLPLNLSVGPDTNDDINLAILLEANRVVKNKKSSLDDITISCLYPDGSTATYSGGSITDGMPGNAISSAGRLKTKTYNFAFENFSFTTK